MKIQLILISDPCKAAAINAHVNPSISKYVFFSTNSMSFIQNKIDMYFNVLRKNNQLVIREKNNF